MPIEHKFLQTNWPNGFQTHNAILDVTPGYEPEVLFIGTFNHGWAWNPAEFFYRRNYFWSIFGCLANNNPNLFNDHIIPELANVWDYCSRFKISFADIVRGTNRFADTDQNQLAQLVVVTSPNLNAPYTWNTYSDAQLNFLGTRNCLSDNVCNIVSYLKAKTSITQVYFTWKLNNSWLSTLANQIVNADYERQIGFTCILSPSGNGFGTLIPGYPTKIKSIMHAWLWVNNPAGNPVYIREGFSHLNHAWLNAANVNPFLF